MARLANQWYQDVRTAPSESEDEEQVCTGRNMNLYSDNIEFYVCLNGLSGI